MIFAGVPKLVCLSLEPGNILEIPKSAKSTDPDASKRMLSGLMSLCLMFEA